MIRENIELARKEKSELIGWLLVNKHLEETTEYQIVLLKISILDVMIAFQEPFLIFGW